ncbi:DUF3152 domain-containing protein [Streptomyces sp. NEAU-S77]|uniref:DUF3152 domain-containing protein n=1 Tax=Streptomyces sp. NEAU-S77 TaxID=3411033 RepID=UPI003B9E5D4C
MTVTEPSPERSAAPPARSSHRRSSRRRRRRRSPVVPLLIGAAVTSGAALAVYAVLPGDGGGVRSAPADSAAATRSPAADYAPTAAPTAPPSRSSRDAGPARPTAPTSPAGTGTPTGTASPAGTGTFVTAKSSGKVIGDGGDVRRFKVQVEEGTGVDPKRAAAEISAVLADERGWTRDRKHSFQLVSGGAYDFEVKIATPDTVDDICGQAGLKTRGEVNCAAGTQVMVNLKRWNTGSPEFDGPIREYRALIVNHEVGHRIGRGHETCPGPGKPAPAMMQQIDGLKGCVANAWPYSKAGKYLGGPSVA